MKLCPSCRRELPEISRYCSQCGQRLHADLVEPPTPPPPPATSGPRQLNIEVLYGMVAMLSLAILGLHFIFSPPTADAIVSRLLLTIELVTIAIAGLYGSFLFRQKP
jgi:hypothetical protein